MITDFLLGWVLVLWNGFVDLLPDGTDLTVPGLSTLSTYLGRADSLIPISGPLTLMLGLLSTVGVFITVRLAITAWQVIKP